MHDQADGLRNLARRKVAQPAAAATRPLRVVLAGSKGGVGVTTIAVNLAVALARQGRSVVLVDADLQRAGATQLLGLDAGHTVGDVLSGRSSLDESLYLGPAGVRVLAGQRASMPGSLAHSAAFGRLTDDWWDVTLPPEIVLFDVGGNLSPLTRWLWEAAHAALIVTTEDAVAVMDAYAAIKLLHADEHQGAVQTVVNLATSSQTAGHAHERLARACYRFLAARVTLAGHVPLDPALKAAQRIAQPAIDAFPAAEGSRAVQTLAAQIAAAAGQPSGRWRYLACRAAG